MIDSSAIQQGVQIAVETGTNFLPFGWKFLGPVISTLATLITAAIIRHVEKRQINLLNNEQQQILLQRAIEAETELLKHKGNEASGTNKSGNSQN